MSFVLFSKKYVWIFCLDSYLTKKEESFLLILFPICLVTYLSGLNYVIPCGNHSVQITMFCSVCFECSLLTFTSLQVSFFFFLDPKLRRKIKWLFNVAMQYVYMLNYTLFFYMKLTQNLLDTPCMIAILIFRSKRSNWLWESLRKRHFKN